MLQAKEYVKPSSLEEAYQLCKRRSSVVVGGMMWLKMENIQKQTIIDLSGLGLVGIEEDEEQFRIGAMTTLRMLETHPGLNREFDGIFRECTRHIVGVQFRNGATVGGSIYGRFGFSDILTCLMALDSYVELYHGGVMPLARFAAIPRSITERNILVRILIKKDGRRAAYRTVRRASTDFPLLACCVAKVDGQWQISMGARPKKAETAVISGEAALGQMDLGEAVRKQMDPGQAALKQADPEQTDPDSAESRMEQEAERIAREGAKAFSYGSNLRGSGAYRQVLAEILIRRLVRQIQGYETDGARETGAGTENALGQREAAAGSENVGEQRGAGIRAEYGGGQEGAATGAEYGGGWKEGDRR